MEGSVHDDAMVRRLRFHWLLWFLTPLATQSYMPTMPLLVTVQLGEPMWQLGLVYSTKMVCSVVGNLICIPLLRVTSPRKLLICFFWARAISGVLHGIACISITSWTMPLLYVRSALHGLSLGSLPISTTWIAVRMPASERPKASTVLMTCLGAGMILGPTWGSALATICPTQLMGAAAPGWNTLVVSLITLYMTHALFDEHEALPKPDTAHGEGPKPPPQRSILLLYLNNFMVFTALIGSESIIPVMLYAMYGKDATETLPFFLTLAAMMFVQAPVTIWAQAHVSNARLAILWTFCPVVPLMFAVHWTDLTPFIPYSLSLILIPLLMMGVPVNSVTCHQALVSQRVHSAHQATVLPLLQTCGQIGRALGPIMFTNFYEVANDWKANSAPNLTLMLLGAFAFLGNLAPFLAFNEIYGGFDDLPPSKDNKKELW